VDSLGPFDNIYEVVVYTILYGVAVIGLPLLFMWLWNKEDI